MTLSQKDRFIGRAARIAMAILAITFTTGQGISFSQERGLTASGNGALEATTQAPYVVQGPRTLFTLDALRCTFGRGFSCPTMLRLTRRFVDSP